MNKIYTTKGVVYAFLIVFLGTLSLQSIATGTPIAPPGQPRYLSMSIMNVENDDSYLPLMERAAKAGVNSFVLNVNWDHVYRKRGSIADWGQIDKEAELAKRLGCKIMLRVWVARHGDGNDGAEGWWPDNVRPVSGDGVRHKDVNGFSFSATEAVNEANGFVREVMEHFRPRQQAGEIVLVTVVANNASEIGYSVDAHNPANNKNELQLFDYSYYSKKAFREWVQAKYRTLAELNKIWNSDYSRFSDIEPPYIKGDVWSGHYGKIGVDWYLFRHSTLKGVIDGFIDVVKGVDGNYKYYNDMGSCYDGLSVLRGTLGFIDLNAKADGFKVNDGAYYPHRFAADLLRSNLPGKIIGNELGNVNGIDEGVWRGFINETYEHGADWFNLFGLDREFNFVNYENLIKETAAKWLDKPVQAINPTQTVTYTLSEAIREGTGKVQGKWRGEYAKTEKPIRVLLIEDLLENKTDGNQLPRVVKNIPDQQGKVDQSFNYEIPAGTFTDPDGIIASITVKGLPNGITFNNLKFSGIPTASGEFIVVVTARDDKGGEVETQFKLRVAQKNGENLSPLVSQEIPVQQGKVGQAFGYEIARGTFTDPDG
ncbi:putative Ig domain-containing protein, partial [Persicitalea sp.]|uniref:putative Ig domain-containing protein n=1 Tax=Persicitalea sp. TaxID=3100273 RepID=UPI0035932252